MATVTRETPDGRKKDPTTFSTPPSGRPARREGRRGDQLYLIGREVRMALSTAPASIVVGWPNRDGGIHGARLAHSGPAWGQDSGEAGIGGIHGEIWLQPASCR